MVDFVGAGCGAADLITVRGMRLLQEADVIIYAGSLVNPALLSYAPEGCEIYNSATMALEDAASLGGVTLLRDSSVRVTKGGQSIALVGVDDWRTGVQNTRTPARGMRSNDCVIVISHSPEAIPQLAAQPGEDGGHWIDAALTGHTLGGQIRVGGYEVFSPLAGDERYGAGWHMENGVKRLVSEGLCGGFLPLRWGTSAEVHVITLRRQTGE